MVFYDSNSRPLMATRRIWPPAPPAWWSSLIIAAAEFAVLVDAHGDPEPFSVPIGDWHGIDGNWSTVNWRVGSPTQPVDVLVSLALSEFWAIGPGGCLPKEPHCAEARGGVYKPDDSHYWSALGTWSLGLEYLRYGGNGFYGRDLLSVIDDKNDMTFAMTGSIIATLTTTDYYLGYMGMGVNQGSFDRVVAESPLTQAVKDFGLIPSYSYGYTAGAYYRETPTSLTLGGYDCKRFVDHSIDFTLGEQDMLPHALVRGITFELLNNTVEPPTNWSSSQYPASTWDTAFEAMVDSTTPFLWLPDRICDEIAKAFDLSYNSTLDLYTLTNDQYRDLSAENTYSVSFTLSSHDNVDNFGEPLNTTGAVNITIPLRAFVSSLRYPFMDETIGYGDPAVPYLALRKAHNSSTYILGRSFLQESYIITKYDSRAFSVHQALFPPDLDTDIVAVPQPPDSPLPPPKVSKKNGLSKEDIGGIVAGVVGGTVLISVGIYVYKKRKAGKNLIPTTKYEPKGNDSSIHIQKCEDRGGIRNVFDMIGAKVRMRKFSTARKGVSEAASNDIYELPGHEVPAELDTSEGQGGMDSSDVSLGLLDNSRQLSDYEQRRIMIDRELRGPVPEYTPAEGGHTPPLEKSMYAAMTSRYSTRIELPTDEMQYQPRHQASDQSLSVQGLNSARDSAPSPASGGIDWNERVVQAPEPAAMASQTSWSALPLRSQSTVQRSGGGYEDWTQYSSPSPPMRHVSDGARGSMYQHSPIDTSNVVCLGPLPENMQMPGQQPIPRILGPVGPIPQQPSTLARNRTSMTESLGSNFTEEEEERMNEMATMQSYEQNQHHRVYHPNGPATHLDTEHIQRQYSNSSSDATPTAGQGHTQPPRIDQGHSRIDSGAEIIHVPQPVRNREVETNGGRIQAGSELIHVPQVPDKRYSWE